MSRTVVRALRASFAALALVGMATTATPASADGGWISLSNTVVTEGDSGTTSLVFTARLVQTATIPVTAHFFAINFHTVPVPGDATAGSACGAGVDFIAIEQDITIPANSNPPQVTISVPVCGDSVIEGSEIMVAGLLNVQGSECLETCAAIGTILDNDQPQTVPIVPPGPTLSVSNTSGLEGDPLFGSSRSLTFNVSLSQAGLNTVTVNYATSAAKTGFNPNATAGTSCLAGADYRSVAGSFTFRPGETSHTVVVPICSDNARESNEDLELRLSSPTNATLADSVGLGIIVNDD